MKKLRMEKCSICAHYIEKLFSILNGVLSELAGLNFSLETITSNVNTLCAKEEYFKYTLNFLLQNIHDQFINFIWKAKRGRDEVNR